MEHKPALIAELKEIITMNRETILRIAQLTGAVMVLEKLIANLTQQAAALHTQITELKEGE